MCVYEESFEKEFPNMPEHPIPYTFGVDIDLLSKFLNRDYIKKSRRSRTRIYNALAEYFSPIAAIDDKCKLARSILSEALIYEIDDWFSGYTTYLNSVSINVLRKYLKSISIPSNLPFDIEMILQTAFENECCYLEDVDECDLRYRHPSKVDFGSKLIRFCKFDAGEELKLLENKVFIENLEALGLLDRWRSVLVLFLETNERNIHVLVKKVDYGDAVFANRYFSSCKHSIEQFLEARVFGLNCESRWCGDCRASNLYPRSPFDDSYTRLILNNRWLFRHYLIEHAVFV